MERVRDKKYWNYWQEIVNASIARNTVELPTFLGLVDFEGKKVLDAGSGVGRVAFKINGFAESITCIDSSDSALQTLSAEVEKQGLQNKIKFAKGDLRALPFEDCAFDIVYSLWTIHYLKQDWQGILRELNRVCKKDGTVIVCFSTEKGSIPKMESFAKPKELLLRKKFTQGVLQFFKKLNKNSAVKKAVLPFYFKSADWAFEVFSETFLPKPLPAKAGEKCLAFLKKHSSKKGCFVDEEVAFVYSIKA